MKKHFKKESVLILAFHEKASGELVIPMVRASKLYGSSWRIQTKREPMWRLPGGEVEEYKNEDPVTAAKREYFEETGLTIEKLSFLGVLEKPSHKKTKGFHYQYIFIAKIESLHEVHRIPKKDGNETLLVGLFTDQNLIDYFQKGILLHGYPMLPSHKKIISEKIGYTPDY